MSTTTHTAPDLDARDRDTSDQDAPDLGSPDRDTPDQQTVGSGDGTPDGGAAGPETTSGADDDVRDQIEAGVLFANGRLAGRRFASLAEAQAWAHPELGDQVVEFNPVCDCSV
ncbi:hypothetical protein ACWFNS_02165 [Oerskovia enterophila]